MKTFNPVKVLEEKIYDLEEINFHKEFIETKTVLGIDIYRYSMYGENIQEYVPILFNELYKLTITSCIKYEDFIFQFYSDNHICFNNKFISTGDGGFQIFDNPIQAIVFSSYFQVHLQRFNSNKLGTTLFKNLFNIIGKIELRYAITTDRVYSFNNNFFGQAIINNSRVLAKDNLNRMLVDFASINWLTQNIYTVENLMILLKNDFTTLTYFKDYDSDKHSLLFELKGGKSPIKAVDILKIGQIQSKNSVLDIYNLRLQVQVMSIPMKGFNKFLISLGNLNTQGIE